MGKAIEFTDANFSSEVLQSDVPVLVDFWAPWCGPCRQIAPTIEALAEENAGKVKVGKVNVDDNPQIAQQYGISSIPTLLFFKGGQVVQRFVGLQPKSRLQETIDSL
ncbi:MAG: thioredoxin [Pirellulaceae bacterium]|nr:MAG: thioredoxin [Pirellulaceae bacterium]